VTHHQYFKA